MKGTIIDYDAIGHTGVISGFDGNRYRFSLQDWKSGTQPKPSMEVDFVPDEGIAREIFMLRTNELNRTANGTPGFWGLFWGWGLGILCLLSGIGTFIDQPEDRDIVAGILFIIASAFLVPPVFNMISEKSGNAISTGPRVIIVIVLLGLAAVAISPDV